MYHLKDMKNVVIEKTFFFLIQKSLQSVVLFSRESMQCILKTLFASYFVSFSVMLVTDVSGWEILGFCYVLAVK